MTNRERIEAYFDDQLSTTEKESLLRDIESDQSLKTEFEFQKEVIEGIQAYRKQELISRLNNVEVASVGSSALTKIIGLIGVVAILGGGMYWYFNTDEFTPESPAKTEVKEDVAPATESIIVVESETPAEETGSKSDEATIQASTKTEAANEAAEQGADNTTGEVNVPQMVEPDSEGIAAVADDHEAPESLNSESVTVTSSADVEIKLDKKYNFHYQVINGDLTLYGSFNESKFEVIELKTTVGLKLYLYYNQRYFELKNDSENIRPLEVLDNDEIIAELDKRRL